MKSCFSSIYQNEKLRRRLADEIAEERFPHAYILAGKPGTGKRTFALQIAAALACESKLATPCSVCDSCEKILGGFSPDVISIRKEADKKEFAIGLIREIKDGLYIAPNELKKRVYILEDTETMNVNAQNAFLKMLEEPPSYVVFLLLCADTEQLLETIKSRAPILHMEQISPEGIEEYLLEHSASAREIHAADPERLKTISLAADGSIGAALTLCEKGNDLEQIRQTVSEFLETWASPRGAELSLFSDKLPGGSEEMTAFLLTLKKTLRDIMVYKHDNACDRLFFMDDVALDALAARITVRKAIRLSETADTLIEKLKFYLDLRLAAVTFCADARRIMME